MSYKNAANHRLPHEDKHGICGACNHKSYKHIGFLRPVCEECLMVEDVKAQGLPEGSVLIYPQTWAYGLSYFSQSYLLEAPEKTLERMKAAAAKDADE